jgi:hypothetical protein
VRDGARRAGVSRGIAPAARRPSRLRPVPDLARGVERAHAVASPLRALPGLRRRAVQARGGGRLRVCARCRLAGSRRGLRTRRRHARRACERRNLRTARGNRRRVRRERVRLPLCRRGCDEGLRWALARGRVRPEAPTGSSGRRSKALGSRLIT